MLALTFRAVPFARRAFRRGLADHGRYLPLESNTTPLLRTVYIDLDQKIRLTCGNSKQQATGKELMAEISFSGVGKIILLQESDGRERRPLWIPITRLCPTAPHSIPGKIGLITELHVRYDDRS